MSNDPRLSFAVIADALPCGLILVGPTGNVEFINGLARQELLHGVDIGAPWRAVCARFGRAPLVASVTGLDVDGDPLLVSVGDEAHRRYYYACACSCPLADGERTLVVVGDAGTALELTQHMARTLRLELARQQPAPAESEPRALAQRLAREVAHRVRNPLAYILGNSELLREHAEQRRGGIELTQAEIVSMLDDIEHGARRIEAVLAKLDEATLDASPGEPLLGSSFYSKR